MDATLPPPFERSSPDDTATTGLAWAAWPADLATPVGAFLALRAREHSPCLLESVEGPARLARYSFIGVDPVARFRGGPAGNTLETVGAGGPPEVVPGAPHEALRAVHARRPRTRAPRGLPPFCGGWIGWIGYEHASTLEPRVPRTASGADGPEAPDLVFDEFQDLLAFDQAEQKVFAITACASAGELDAAHARLERLACDALVPSGDGPFTSGDLVRTGPLVTLTEPEAYRAGVRELKRSIAAGDIFQAVLSQRFEQPFEGDPFTLYRVLRIVNPSPYMFYFEADGTTLIGSSPERLVTVRGRSAENRPIAGTRPRGADAAADERLADELAADPKERAEHDMLVDLARNDLGRVARIGTVDVAEHAVLERFARVQHLSSRVTCELASGADALDALCACFPAGTVSGAPKIRAMELLAGLEGLHRGPYGGAFGYLDGAGNLDTALVIRTFVARATEPREGVARATDPRAGVARAGVLALQAGAGVVSGSDPERELEETLHKARALLDAVALADSDAFRAPRGEDR